jgi:hypothetical protein
LRKGSSERRNYPRWLLGQLRILLREQTACASFPNRGKILRDSLDAKEFCITPTMVDEMQNMILETTVLITRSIVPNR